jgi:hypothetical protein
VRDALDQSTKNPNFRLVPILRPSRAF